MKTYNREELKNKIDIILDNIVDGRPINLLKERFETWLSVEWTSGTIDAKDFMFAKKYGFENIEFLTAMRN